MNSIFEKYQREISLFQFKKMFELFKCHEDDKEEIVDALLLSTIEYNAYIDLFKLINDKERCEKKK
jgi:hypothetical protein